MKIAIYGAGNFGQYVLHNIEEHTGISHKVVLFIDNATDKKQKFICNKPIISLDEFLGHFTKMVDCVFIAVCNKRIQQTMALSLFTKGYTDLYIIQEHVFIGRLDIFGKTGELKSYIRKMQEIKPYLASVGYKVIDTCNLKCKSCIECSNIAIEENILSIDLLVKSLDGLKRKFSEVGYIFIKGGEPFLNANIAQYIKETRKRFPYSSIRIITNGLLLPKISDEIINVIRDNGIEIGISEYPPTREMMDKILDFGLERQIEIFIENEIFITEFEKNLSYTNEDYIAAWENCNDNECHLLANGRIYMCSVALRNYDWRNYFGLNISEDQMEDCSADVINGEEDGWNILAKISQHSKVCKYCSVKPEHVPWEVSGSHVDKDDWIVKGGKSFEQKL